jgi:hypothetical protein
MAKTSGRITSAGSEKLKRHIRSICAAYYRRFKGFPPLDWLARRTRISRGELISLLTELQREGDLKRDGSSYALTHPPEPVRKEEPEEPDSEPETKPDPPPTGKTPIETPPNRRDPGESAPISREEPPGRVSERPEPEKRAYGRSRASEGRWDSVVFWGLRIALLAVGLGAASLSVYFTRVWLLDFLSPFRAALLSTLMVVFAASAFEVAVLLWRRRAYIPVVIFAILWAIVTGFSMFSTVGGQFFRYRVTASAEAAAERISVAATTRTRLLWETLTDEEASLEREEAQRRAEIDGYLEILSQFDSADVAGERRQDYLDAQWRRVLAERRLAEIRERLAEIRAEKRDFLSQAAEAEAEETVEAEPPGFYAWLAAATGGREESWAFWSFLAPAMLIDLLCPIALAAAFFIDRREEETNE